MYRLYRWKEKSKTTERRSTFTFKTDLTYTAGRLKYRQRLGIPSWAEKPYAARLLLDVLAGHVRNVLRPELSRFKDPPGVLFVGQKCTLVYPKFNRHTTRILRLTNNRIPIVLNRWLTKTTTKMFTFLCLGHQLDGIQCSDWRAARTSLGKERVQITHEIQLLHYCLLCFFYHTT